MIVKANTKKKIIIEFNVQMYVYDRKEKRERERERKKKLNFLSIELFYDNETIANTDLFVDYK